MTAEQRAAMLRTAITPALGNYRDMVQPISGVAAHLRKNAKDKTDFVALHRSLAITYPDEFIMDLAVDADHLATSLHGTSASSNASLSAKSISVLSSLDSELPALSHEFSVAYENWLATISECAEANADLASISRTLADIRDKSAVSQTDVYDRVDVAVAAQLKCANAADAVVAAAIQLANRLESILATVDSLAADLDT